jgi:hypothetical protein|tara:strand:+ start:392 stop:598 length:207 start_codon:yes stop_codon:yes gene_type:complete
MSKIKGFGDNLIGAHYIETSNEELDCSQFIIALFPFAFHFELMHDINTLTIKVRLFDKCEVGFYILID